MEDLSIVNHYRRYANNNNIYFEREREESEEHINIFKNGN